MARTMAERLEQARARTFVGRRAELATFDRLLATSAPAVVVVHGPAGIGKSTLVRQFAARAAEVGAIAWPLDARDLPPTLEALELRLAPLLDGTTPGERPVVILDGYELLEIVDTALRERLAPRLPSDTLLVLAGQHAPAVEWRSDQGWASLLHVLPLGNLGPADCGRYLDAREVPAELQPEAIAFSHGHPLALALVSEVIRQKGEMSGPASTDVVKSLVDRLVDHVPSPDHQQALEAASQVRTLDESLLARMLDQEEVYDLFSWLRSLPYAQSGAYGLFLHDLVRDVLAGDLRWRHPQRFAEYHDRARAEYFDRLGGPDRGAQAMALLDLIYLHPDLRNMLQSSEESAALRIEPATPADAPAVAQMVEAHEGAESAALARHWLAEQPGAWWVVRGTDQTPEGAHCLLPLDVVASAPGDDPAVIAALDELGRHPPLRSGETATLFRFWMARETYQAVSAAQSIIATQFARHFLTTRGLAVTLIPFADPERWATFCAYSDQRRAPVADFTVGGRRYACFEHDWRIVPPEAWLARMSRREIGSDTEPADHEPAEARVLLLDETAFAGAVRQALRDYSRPDRLRDSALLRCRFVKNRLTADEGPAEQVDVLRAQLKEAVDSLGEGPADRRLQRVLVRAYLSPAPSLERAAEVLELPSSTFRRLLGTAVGRVTTLLWHRELDG